MSLTLRGLAAVVDSLKTEVDSLKKSESLLEDRLEVAETDLSSALEIISNLESRMYALGEKGDQISDDVLEASTDRNNSEQRSVMVGNESRKGPLIKREVNLNKLFVNLGNHGSSRVQKELPQRVKQACVVSNCSSESKFYCSICETESPSNSLFELKQKVYCQNHRYDHVQEFHVETLAPSCPISNVSSMGQVVQVVAAEPIPFDVGNIKSVFSADNVEVRSLDVSHEEEEGTFEGSHALSCRREGVKTGGKAGGRASGRASGRTSGQTAYGAGTVVVNEKKRDRSVDERKRPSIKTKEGSDSFSGVVGNSQPNKKKKKKQQ